MLFTAIAIIAVTAGFTAPARAGLIFSGPASYCDPTMTQPFLPWGDDATYALTPGGSFESGTPGWGLSGGARVVWGNEPFYVHSRSDKQSLSLPAGSSATSPTMCFAAGDWHLRLFAVSSGATSGLKVTVLVRSLCGVLSLLDGGTVGPSGTWQPSKQLALTLTNLTSIATSAISLRFTPAGSSGSWRIDDVYLDPYKIT